MFFTPMRYSAVLDDVGSAVIPHGLDYFGKPISFAQAFYEGNSGEMVPLKIHAIDGINVHVQGGISSRKVRLTLLFCDQADNW